MVQFLIAVKLVSADWLLILNFNVVYKSLKKSYAKSGKYRDLQKREDYLAQHLDVPKNSGQVDSPELLETPEITEMTKNLTKVTKYLNKSKETLINYA